MKLEDMTEGQMAEWLAMLAYINKSAVCASLLYDLNLLPEQIDGDGDERKLFYLCSVVGHIQKLEADHSKQLEAITNTIFAIETAIEPLTCRIGADSVNGPKHED